MPRICICILFCIPISFGIRLYFWNVFTLYGYMVIWYIEFFLLFGMKSCRSVVFLMKYIMEKFGNISKCKILIIYESF